jgi:type IV pilus assembly protein PilY1
VFGNGYGGKSAQAILFVVNIQTGEVSQIAVGEPGGNGLGGVAVVRNPSGLIERLYAGDLKGQLWRFDTDPVAPSGLRVALSGKSLFQASSGQSIVQPPAVFSDPGGGHVLVVGTGSLVTADDVTNSSAQSVYGVRDTASGPTTPPLLRSDLKSRELRLTPPREEGAQQFFTLSGDSLDATSRGWFVDLTVHGWAGLRVIHPVQAVTNRVALVSAVAPGSADASCMDASGRGVNLLLPVSTGLMVDQPTFDTNGNGRLDSDDAVVAGYATNADGVDSIVRGQSLTNKGTGTGCMEISIQNTTGQLSGCVDVGSTPTGLVIRDRVWRRILNPPIR